MKDVVLDYHNRSANVIGIRKSKKDRHTMAKRKRTKGQTTIYNHYTKNIF